MKLRKVLEKNVENMAMGMNLIRVFIPKSSILIGFSIINHPFWGTTIFGNIYIDNILMYLARYMYMKKKYILLQQEEGFAVVEGLSQDLESVPDRFIMSILCGRCGTVNYHPVLKLRD